MFFFVPFFILFYFTLFFTTAHSFKCYQCGPKTPGTEYKPEQCEKDQKEVECSSNFTCIKMHGKTEEDKEVETRGCYQKTMCDTMKKLCADAELKKAQKIKECEVACCVSDGDKPCNSGFTVSAYMIMIMFAVLCGFKLF